MQVQKRCELRQTAIGLDIHDANLFYAINDSTLFEGREKWFQSEDISNDEIRLNKLIKMFYGQFYIYVVEFLNMINEHSQPELQFRKTKQP
jgi:hypothetical protein